jgi:hypothetical protein
VKLHLLNKLFNILLQNSPVLGLKKSGKYEGPGQTSPLKYFPSEGDLTNISIYFPNTKASSSGCLIAPTATSTIGT